MCHGFLGKFLERPFRAYQFTGHTISSVVFICIDQPLAIQCRATVGTHLCLWPCTDAPSSSCSDFTSSCEFGTRNHLQSLSLFGKLSHYLPSIAFSSLWLIVSQQLFLHPNLWNPLTSTGRDGAFMMYPLYKKRLLDYYQRYFFPLTNSFKIVFLFFLSPCKLCIAKYEIFTKYYLVAFSIKFFDFTKQIVYNCAALLPNGHPGETSLALRLSYIFSLNNSWSQGMLRAVNINQ